MGPRPMPFHPIPPVCPTPIPEPWPVSSGNKTVIVDGAGDVTVTRKDGVYDGSENRYELQPFSQEELVELFDSVDGGGI